MTKGHANDGEPNPQLAFTAFGRLYAKVAAFEQFMRVALATHEVNSGAYAKLSDEQKRSKSDKILRMDFAQLEQRISNLFCKNADDKAVFKDARDFRNNLAHNFWQNSFSFLHSARGVFLIEQHCAQLEVQFEVLGEHLINLAGTDMAHYVAWVQDQTDMEQHLDEYERLIGEGWQAHLDAGHIAPPNAKETE